MILPNGWQLDITKQGRKFRYVVWNKHNEAVTKGGRMYASELVRIVLYAVRKAQREG